jgi:hypothetical protein
MIRWMIQNRNERPITIYKGHNNYSDGTVGQTRNIVKDGMMGSFPVSIGDMVFLSYVAQGGFSINVHGTTAAIQLNNYAIKVGTKWYEMRVVYKRINTLEEQLSIRQVVFDYYRVQAVLVGPMGELKTGTRVFSELNTTWNVSSSFVGHNVLYFKTSPMSNSVSVPFAAGSETHAYGTLSFSVGTLAGSLISKSGSSYQLGTLVSLT